MYLCAARINLWIFTAEVRFRFRCDWYIIRGGQGDTDSGCSLRTLGFLWSVLIPAMLLAASVIQRMDGGSSAPHPKTVNKKIFTIRVGQRDK